MCVCGKLAAPGAPVLSALGPQLFCFCIFVANWFLDCSSGCVTVCILVFCFRKLSFVSQLYYLSVGMWVCV